MKKIFVIAAAAVFSLCLLAGCGSKAVTVVENGIIQGEGTYQVSATLEGGSGKASIETPVTVTVDSSNAMTATIVWGSSNYDLMVVQGVEYTPTSTNKNSTFQIPVSSLDQPLSVQAETTAMSTAHLIDYTITFDATSARAA